VPYTVPSNKKQHAASLLGRGLTREQVANMCGISERTVSRWNTEDDEFIAMVKATRDAALDEQPDVRRTFEAALHATHRDGRPDHQTRLAAAKLLLVHRDDMPDLRDDRAPEDGVLVIYAEPPADAGA
jgi:hypothetical protein